MKSKGKVYLVGAGPGDAGLFSIRGAELLSRADVVVHDHNVSPSVLGLVSSTAEILGKPRDDSDGLSSQAQKIQLMLARARDGKTVVRLHRGDPKTLNDGKEELQALAAAQIPFDVIPAMTAPLGVPDCIEMRPLFGRRVVVTRAREQSSQLTRQLADLGAEVLEIPTIKIVPPDNKEPLADAFLAFGEYDWLVFTSPNGVTSFFEYFLKGFQDIRALGHVRIAAVGPGTAAKIQELHIKVDVTPEENLAGKIADAIQKYESVENLKVLLLRAEMANQELPKLLDELGAIVDDVACYKTVPETEDRTGAAAQFLQHGADWILFTSGSTVENFHARFDLPKVFRQFADLKLASIGPETSKALEKLGLKPTIEARQHNLEGLVSALESYMQRKPASK
jgi:uroporphyrinogen-III synthase